MTFTALVFTLLGAALLYLQAPRQAWLRQPLPLVPARLAGIASLLAGLLVWQTMTAPVTGFFIQFTLLMLAFSAFPYLALLGGAGPPGMTPQGRDLTRHWLAKGLAGLILGLVIGIGLSGILAWAGPGGIGAPDKYMVMMWVVLPVWMLVLTFCFLFRSFWHAWAWLGAAALLLHAALIACQHWL